MEEMLARLRAVEEDARARLDAAGGVAEIDAVERETLGNASALAEARRGLRGGNAQPHRSARREQVVGLESV